MDDASTSLDLLHGDPKSLLYALARNIEQRPYWVMQTRYRALLNMNTRLLLAYEEALGLLTSVADRLASALSDSTLDLADPGSSLGYVFAISLRNDIVVCKSLCGDLTRHDHVPKPPSEVAQLERSYQDFNSLLVAARQFADALSLSAYLYHRCDIPATNYALLSSLLSFMRFAPESFAGVALHDSNMERLIRDYSVLKPYQRAKLKACELEHPSFRSRMHWLGSTMFKNERRDQRLIDLYEFASEFTHVGLLSTLLATRRSSVISGDGTGLAYLPSTLAFLEVAFEVADTTLAFYCSTYATTLGTLAQSFFPDVAAGYVQTLRDVVERMAVIDSMGRLYKYFTTVTVCRQPYRAQCPCGSALELILGASALCESCGSAFEPIVLGPGGSAIRGGAGPIAILGSPNPPPDAATFIADTSRLVRPTFTNRLPTE